MGYRPEKPRKGTGEPFTDAEIVKGTRTFLRVALAGIVGMAYYVWLGHPAFWIWAALTYVFLIVSWGCVRLRRHV